ncbi:MAG: aldo/keto reductase [Candidatus Nomurabacteria bacterium]|nr:aldo/keto reductase [Candidatus Nomurabacteria bacterium]
MKIPTKKLNTGFEMPVYGLGTWQMGGRENHDLANDDDKDIQGIKDSIANGITHIDTAEKYADGYTEIIVGKAIKEFDRSKIFLVSKVRKENLKYNDVINACKKSLERLQTDYLDLYLIHFRNLGISLKETMHAMDSLKESGLIKNIGVCNFTKESLAEAQSYTKNKIVCNQVHYNLIFREPERKGLVEYCQNNDVFLSAWRPIQKGDLLENIPPILSDMCDKYKKTPAQIAINWLISQPYVITISKTNNHEHLEDNLGTLGWEMQKEDIEKLRNEFPNQKDISDAVPLG